jgi:hypothetical protein
MIPDFDSEGNLPPGVYLASWAEFALRYGNSTHRRRLLQGLEVALDILKNAGCQRVYVDGSFVTDKLVPDDYDAAWEPSGVDLKKLLSHEPVFGEFGNRRAAQKAKFFGEFFPSSAIADQVGTTFFDFFQINKNTGNAKGIIALDL